MQSTIGAIGTSSDGLSKLRRPKVAAIGTATREGECRRLYGRQDAFDMVSPMSYHSEAGSIKLLSRSPMAVIGSSTRESERQRLMAATPGPGDALVRSIGSIECSMC